MSTVEPAGGARSTPTSDEIDHDEVARLLREHLRAAAPYLSDYAINKLMDLAKSEGERLRLFAELPSVTLCTSTTDGHRCEIYAGHDGMHAADFGGSDGFGVWDDDTADPPEEQRPRPSTSAKPTGSTTTS